MKTYSLSIIFVAFLMLFASCVKDEMPELEEATTSDIGLYVNEVLSTGEPDWIELYNSNSEDLDISGFKISDGPVAKYTFPEGTMVLAKGYLVYPCNEFGLSSGGEEVYLWDTEDNLVDQIAFPALDAGVSYGRVSDGDPNFSTMGPSEGSANSTVNYNPYIEALPIAGINDNEAYVYEIIASDASGMRDVKLFIETDDNVLFEEMAPLGGGTYKFIIPAMAAGTIGEYYIVATDETGKKTYYPETAPDAKASFEVADGLTRFLEVALSTENPADGEAVKFTVSVYDRGGVDQVRLYYVLNDQVADDKESVDLVLNESNIWEGEIPGQVENTVIRYYLRATDNEGLKSYYPVEETDSLGNVISDFNHDVETTWPSVTVAPPVILEALVINEILGTGSPDFIELYNGTASEIDLGGYKIHDSDPTEAYTIPAGTKIAAGGFYVLDCDGDVVTLFKVSSGGEDITLLDPSDNVVDQLLLVDWPEGHAGSVGRVMDGAAKWVSLETPSKGASNNTK